MKIYRCNHCDQYLMYLENMYEEELSEFITEINDRFTVTQITEGEKTLKLYCADEFSFFNSKTDIEYLEYWIKELKVSFSFSRIESHNGNLVLVFLKEEEK